jgi:hypothetical protein
MSFRSILVRPMLKVRNCIFLVCFLSLHLTRKAQKDPRASLCSRQARPVLLWHCVCVSPTHFPALSAHAGRRQREGWKILISAKKWCDFIATAVDGSERRLGTLLAFIISTRPARSIRVHIIIIHTRRAVRCTENEREHCWLPGYRAWLGALTYYIVELRGRQAALGA